ncbi:MAG: hypothetical protein ACKVJ4_06690 [Flavobacteriales bacterium]
MELKSFIGGDLTQSNYRWYQSLDRTTVHVTPVIRDFDTSGGVVLYRGGVLTYKLP